MKKILLIAVLSFFLCGSAYAADTMMQDLAAPAGGVAAATDKVYILDATGPADRAETVLTTVQAALTQGAFDPRNGITVFGTDGSSVIGVSNIVFVPVANGTSNTVVSDGRGGATYYHSDLNNHASAGYASNTKLNAQLASGAVAAVSLWAIPSAGVTVYGETGSPISGASNIWFRRALAGTSTTVVSDGKGGVTVYVPDTVGTGTPGGDSRSFQINNAGALSGSSAYWDSSGNVWIQGPSGTTLFHVGQNGVVKMGEDGVLTIDSTKHWWLTHPDSGNTVLQSNPSGTGTSIYADGGTLIGVGAMTITGQLAAPTSYAGVSPMTISGTTTLTIDQTRAQKFFVDATSTVTMCPISYATMTGATIPTLTFIPIGNTGITIFANSSTIPIYSSGGTNFQASDAYFVSPMPGKGGVYGYTIIVDTVVTGTTAFHICRLGNVPENGTLLSGCTPQRVGNGI